MQQLANVDLVARYLSLALDGRPIARLQPAADNGHCV
jgi:hypothetical protein